MMPFYYICKTHSVPGYLKLRYGEGPRLIAGVSFTFLTVMVSGASMFAMAKILHLLLGWNMDVSIWVSSITVAIYVTLGGLLSAVFDELLQFFLIWFGSLLIPILGMLWKRATPAGGFWGFLAAIAVSIGMWVHVHTFPDGYRPQPKITLQPATVVTLERNAPGAAGKISRIVVESGAVDLVNVPGVTEGTLKQPIDLPAILKERAGEVPVQILAPQVIQSGSREDTKFGVEAVPVALKPGVRITSTG